MQRDDPAIGPAELTAAYEAGVADLRAAVPGKWSTLEVVAHLADTEIYFADRIERALALDRPLLIGVDERPYPARLNYQGFELGEQLDLFAALRRHVARVLRMQPADAWTRTAVHSETGLVTVRRLVLQPVRHLPFIAAKRAALTRPAFRPGREIATIPPAIS